MNSVYHARSSASHFGGIWEDYHDLHRFLDSSKSIHANVPHRMFLHSDDIGRFCLKMKFGETIKNSDGHEVFVDHIMDQHLMEDFYFKPKADHWLEHVRVNRIIVHKNGIIEKRDARGRKRESVVPEDVLDYISCPMQGAVKKFGGIADDYKAIVSFFSYPGSIAKNPNADLLFCNSFGIFLCEEIFGSVIVNSLGKNVPTRILAEKIVHSQTGEIACPGSIISQISALPWMIGTKDTTLHPK